MTYIPYNKRCIKLPSGFHFIYPYINKERENPLIELILDNNALIRCSGWISNIKCMDKNIQKKFLHRGKGYVGFNVNFGLALVEQYLSNEEFQQNATCRIDEYIKKFEDELGIPFADDLSADLFKLLQHNENQNKTEFIRSFLYVILLYRMSSAKRNDEKPFQLLQQLKDKNVPCFSSIIMLCCLAEYLNKNQNIKMIGDEKPAYSYLQNFIIPKSGKKGEHGLEEKYFRNRAGDLSFWLSFPALMQNGYELIGEPMIVTADKPLKEFIFRCFPFVWQEDRKMAICFDEKCFEQQHVEKIKNMIKDILWEFIPLNNGEEKFIRMENLKNHVLDGADENLKVVVEKIWNDWFLPGFGKSFQTVQA